MGYFRLTQNLTRVTHLPIFLSACCGLTATANASGVVQVRNNLDYTNNLLGFHSGKFTEMYFVSGLRQECQSEQHFGKRLTIIETDKREDN